MQRKARSRADLNKSVVPDRVDVPVVAQAKERGENPTEHHSRAEVVAQGQALSEYATVGIKHIYLRATAYMHAKALMSSAMSDCSLT